MKQWGDMSQVFIANGRARLPESLDDSGNLERVPGVDTVAKRLAWRAGICLGLLLIGFLAGTLELRKENEHLSSVIGSLPYSMQAPALLQSHGGGVGITSDGGQVVVSCGDLPEPWISTDHKHAVISVR